MPALWTVHVVTVSCREARGQNESRKRHPPPVR